MQWVHEIIRIIQSNPTRACNGPAGHICSDTVMFSVIKAELAVVKHRNFQVHHQLHYPVLVLEVMPMSSQE